MLIKAAGIVAEHYARGAPVESVGAVLGRLAKAEPSIAAAVIGGLARGWPKGKAAELDAQIESDLEQLLTRLSPDSRGLLVKLARSWGSTRFEKYAREVTVSLLRRLDDDALAAEQRLAAAVQLIEFQPLEKEAVVALLARVSPQTPPALAAGIIAALQASESPEVSTLLILRLPGLTPQSRSAAIALLLSRPRSTAALLEAVDRAAVQLAELSLDQKQALAAHPQESIRRRARQLLNRGGALPNPDRQKVLAQLLPITKETGNAEAGKAVFKKQCAKCHMHGGEGTRIGPDLTGMAVHPKAELLTHIIDPSRNVEGNFRVYTVVTDDGLVLNGLLAAESKTAIELFDAEGKKRVVLREEIDELVASPKSLMPEGFEKQVERQDISNLLEFLTQRGKFLPLDLSKVATIASDRGMFVNKQADAERLIFPDWGPKTFSGVPFQLTDPQGGKVANVILLHGPNGAVTSQMPRSVELPCNGPARAIHLLSGVSGWGYPLGREGSVSLVVRLHYADGEREDHELKNGLHFADYIRRVDVPKSEFAFKLRNQQIRYLAVVPRRSGDIERIELIKGPDRTAPVVMAVTLEAR